MYTQEAKATERAESILIHVSGPPKENISDKLLKCPKVLVGFSPSFLGFSILQLLGVWYAMA